MAVNQGGAQGRPRNMHMGTSGVNRGSPKKKGHWAQRLAPRPAPRPGGQQKQPWRPAPQAKAGPGQVGWWPHLQAQVKQQKRVSTPKPPANIFASGAWKSPAYNLEVLNLNQNVGQQQRDLQRQLADMRVYHEQGNERVQQDYKDDLYRANASLAGRGIYQSGMRENTDTTRKRVLDQTLGDLTQQFGAGAQGRVNTDLYELGSYLNKMIGDQKTTFGILGTDYRNKYAEEQKGVMAQKQAAAPKPKSGGGKPKASGGKNPWVKQGSTIFYRGNNGKLTEAPKQKHALKMFKQQQAKQKPKGNGKGKGHKH